MSTTNKNISATLLPLIKESINAKKSFDDMPSIRTGAYYESTLSQLKEGIGTVERQLVEDGTCISPLGAWCLIYSNNELTQGLDSLGLSTRCDTM